VQVNFVVAAGNAAEDIAGVIPASYPEVLTVTAMAGTTEQIILQAVILITASSAAPA
jgi:hypothetical protein